MILPLSYEEASDSEVNLNGYESQLLLFTYIRLTATESSIHTKSLAYTLMVTQLLHSLESSTLLGLGSIYILSSTDRYVSFYQNSSVWLDGLDSQRYIYIYIYIYKINLNRKSEFY